jgi:hypothetical protein
VERSKKVSVRPNELTPAERVRIYRHMRAQGFSRLTIKVLMSYRPDGMDRLTVILGKGMPYDYQLMEDSEFRYREIDRLLRESKSKS